jgi:cytochrome c-type biogenesis protein CcmH/NrfG
LGRCQFALGLVGGANHSLAQAEQLDPASEELTRELARLKSAGLRGRLRGWWRKLQGT